MADVEKVIKGLEELRENMQSRNQGDFVKICDDAIELLKVQERIIKALESDCKETLDVLSEQPEIVRCKDCKHFGRYYGDSKKGVCEKLNIIGRPEEWFCADGER